ncbi:methyltransferase domain-containing protein [Salegentibacter sp. F188]|uniref:Methyltransferase domain-containing protein n=1 Tax=Autumnicola patrickiae TaxID=3075591 RepID=A0ABU3E2G5_9FLAO|nr:methyltransferase domain-containing protein [Salegentibacter sp. F188]MDT0690168.1 methyltransferase domain-containing protein [Salegentibacter sp. F188]
MNRIDTSRRTDEEEIMDDFELSGKELKKTLRDLDNINKWLGGNNITIQGVKKLFQKVPKEKGIEVVDVGCGNGAILREIAKWGRKNDRKLKLTGIDANPHAIEIAEKMSEAFPELQFKTLNIFSEEFKRQEYDIILCTLTLHHFKNPDIIELLNCFYRQVRIGIVINDLHRSKAAYRLFQAFCSVFINNKIARKDGLISILRGFKKTEIAELASYIPSDKQEVNWKWAFRYRWIIEKEQ